MVRIKNKQTTPPTQKKTPGRIAGPRHDRKRNVGLRATDAQNGFIPNFNQRKNKTILRFRESSTFQPKW